MRRRNVLATASSVALADALVVAMYQTGMLRRVPDLPGRGFDSNRVLRSPPAYPLGIPDGLLGAALHGSLLALLGRRTRPWRRVRGGLAMAGAAVAVLYLGTLLLKQRRLCIYCLVAIGATLAWVPAALEDLRPHRTEAVCSGHEST